MLPDRSFQSNMMAHLKVTKSRKHAPHTDADFKPGIGRTARLAAQAECAIF